MESDGPNNSHATLYVGDLHLDCTELMLYNKFSSAGMVNSVRICRHTITKESLGYAYVNFSQRHDAEQALKTLNFDEMLGNPMRIMWSQRNPSLRKSGLGNVFIKNLHKSIDNKAMYDTFSAFGFILSCKVATDEMGVSKGYGFVHFETENAATNAIEKVNGMLLIDQKVFVGKFIPRAERDKRKNFTNLYIKNIGDDVDDEKLFTIFRPFGQINSHRVMIDGDGKSKGFGFVAFEEPEAAKRACDEYNGQVWNGKVIYVGRAQMKDERKAELLKNFENAKIELIERDQGVNLYIKNLDDSIDDERLRNEFMKYGTITSAKVMTENGRSKGFGFVCYSTPEEATHAVTGMNGSIVANKPLYVSLAQRREDRKAHLASQYNQHLAGMQIQQMGQMVQPDGTNYFMPPMPQAQHFYPPPMTQIRATHRWPAQPAAQVPAGAQATSTFPMQAAPFRTAPHQKQPGPRNVRPMAPRQHPVPNLLQADRPVAPNAGDVPTGALNSARASNYKSNDNPPAVSRGGAAAAVALVAQPAVHVPGNEPLTPSMLVSATPQKQKQMLGERLFPLIREINPELPGKITGMLLEMDNSNLFHMLEDGDLLRAKVEEAVAVLKAHQPKQQVAAVVAD